MLHNLNRSLPKIETDLIPVLSEHERRLLPHGARQPGPLDGGHRLHHRAAAAGTCRHLVEVCSLKS